MATDSTRQVISVAHLAKREGCHQETIRRAIRAGELKAHRNRLKAGAPLFIYDVDAVAWAKARKGE